MQTRIFIYIVHNIFIYIGRYTRLYIEMSIACAGGAAVRL